MRTFLIAQNITLLLLTPFYADLFSTPLAKMLFALYVCILGIIGIYITERDSETE